MTGKCFTCNKTFRVPGHRGDKVGNYRCPDCKTQLTGVTAGRARGRYLDPITGYVITLGLTGYQLEAPHRLVFTPGAEWRPRGPYYCERETSHMITDKVSFRGAPDKYEQQNLDRVAGRVLGAGCVVSYDVSREELPPLAGHGRAGLRLVTAEDPGEPTEWIVNEPVKYGKCVACGGRTVNVPEAHIPHEWTTDRRYIWRGRGYNRHREDVDQGPHPAGSLTCYRCDPRR